MSAALGNGEEKPQRKWSELYENKTCISTLSVAQSKNVNNNNCHMAVHAKRHTHTHSYMYIYDTLTQSLNYRNFSFSHSLALTLSVSEYLTKHIRFRCSLLPTFWRAQRGVCVTSAHSNQSGCTLCRCPKLRGEAQVINWIEQHNTLGTYVCTYVCVRTIFTIFANALGNAAARALGQANETRARHLKLLKRLSWQPSERQLYS